MRPGLARRRVFFRLGVRAAKTFGQIVFSIALCFFAHDVCYSVMAIDRYYVGNFYKIFFLHMGMYVHRYIGT
jgi:hypothetical protein